MNFRKNVRILKPCVLLSLGASFALAACGSSSDDRAAAAPARLQAVRIAGRRSDCGQLDCGQLDCGQLDCGQLDRGQLDRG